MHISYECFELFVFISIEFLTNEFSYFCRYIRHYEVGNKFDRYLTNTLYTLNMHSPVSCILFHEFL